MEKKYDNVEVAEMMSLYRALKLSDDEYKKSVEAGHEHEINGASAVRKTLIEKYIEKVPDEIIKILHPNVRKFNVSELEKSLDE